MTEEGVARLLRSHERLVVIEAAAGCGKTHQGASYADDIAATLIAGRVLILTHTHAARSVFTDRTRTNALKVEIRTLDGFLTEIATAYHNVLGLPPDVATWALDTRGFGVVAEKVADFLSKVPSVAKALARRYPVIICDEHQDASQAQHAAIMALNAVGSKIRIFGDPMQIIFAEEEGIHREAAIRSTAERWWNLRAKGIAGDLRQPHRWKSGTPELGDWILLARESLSGGCAIDLSVRLPPGLHVWFAENAAKLPHSALHFDWTDRAPIDRFVRSTADLLVLTVGNDRVQHINAFFNRRLRIWEGHTREALTSLMKCIREHRGDPVPITDGVVKFITSVSTGFSASSDGARLKREVIEGCGMRTRGKPVHLQAMAQHILTSPDHKGVSAALTYLVRLVRNREQGFADVNLDLYSEIMDAIMLGSHDDPDAGIREIARRRTLTHPKPPRRCLSTIHKSKGLECDNVLLMLCDKNSFSGTEYKRRLLYVALSRAKNSLGLVLSKNNPSPLFRY